MVTILRFDWNLKNFSGGTIGVSRLDFTGKTGGGGVSNTLIVMLSAVGLLVHCLLLLLVLYLHLLYSVMWCLYVQDLMRLYYIVTIYTDNVYYVTRALILKLLYNIPIFVLTALIGILIGQSLMPCVASFWAVAVLIFLVSFCYPFNSCNGWFYRTFQVLIRCKPFVYLYFKTKVHILI